MSVPEGKMRYDMVRHEVWLVATLLNDIMRESGHPRYGGESLKQLVKPILARMNNYLEATDGSPAAYVPNSSQEADLG